MIKIHIKISWYLRKRILKCQYNRNKLFLLLLHADMIVRLWITDIRSYICLSFVLDLSKLIIFILVSLILKDQLYRFLFQSLIMLNKLFKLDLLKLLAPVKLCKFFHYLIMRTKFFQKVNIIQFVDYLPIFLNNL